MKFVDTKMEQLLAPQNNTVDEESEVVKGKRKEIREIIDKKNQGKDYFTLGKNGLIPNGIRTEKKMKEYEQTVKKQDEAERFALEFNQMKKKYRKEMAFPDICEKLNGVERSKFVDDGIYIGVVSNLTLLSIPEILEALDVIITDNKIVENENVKLLYEPIMDEKKYIIEDISIVVFITNTGMYKLYYKWLV